MKRYLSHITIASIVIIMVIGSFGHVAYAGGCVGIPGIGGFNLSDCVSDVMGLVINQIMSIAAFILALAGYLLSFSIKLTLNIKLFVDNTPAIYTVWKSIRDISGMFLIFTLLFAAIKMILSPIGVPGPSAKNLIVTVVMAGVLINFSFFVASVGIDVSNVISAQLYKTIAPASDLNGAQAIRIDGFSAGNGIDGGLSDIFMSSLKITKFYDKEGFVTVGELGQGAGTTIAKVILGGILGIVTMLTAAISFFLASLAFIIRFVILIFLLGFSPIWFAAYAVPDLKKYADKWMSTYKSQLIFMPVYLLLLYFALNVLQSSKLMTAGANTSWNENLLIFGMNAVFVIIMLNAPLLAAISVLGDNKFTKWAGGFGAGAIWSKVGRWSGRNSVGATAAWARDSKLGRSIERTNPFVGKLANIGLTKVSSAGFGGGKDAGYDQVRKKKIETYTKMADHSRYNEAESIRIAQKRGIIGNDGKPINDFVTIGLEQQLLSKQNDYARKGAELARATTPQEQNRIKAEMGGIQKQIDAIDGSIKKRKKELLDKIQNEPKSNIAQKFENKDSKFGRDVANAIRKKKTPVDEIIGALKKETSSGDDNKSPKP